jgi:hypothetical protein
MTDSNSVSTPMKPGVKLSRYDGGDRVNSTRYRSLIGSLCYLTCMRQDISYSVGVVSRFMEEPVYTHWKALKRILRYIRGTESLRLFFSRTDEYKLVGYSDSDWCRDIDNRKSTSRYIFFMGDTVHMVVEKITHCDTLNMRSRIYGSIMVCVCNNEKNKVEAVNYKLLLYFF